MKILILGNQQDFQVNHVAACLQQHGAEVLVLDIAQIGNELHLDWHAKHNEGLVSLGSQVWRFSEIHACYWHRLVPPNSAEMGKNAQALLNTLLLQVNIFWVNSLAAIRYHQVKPLQLSHAQALGALIPATYIGSSLSSATDFLATQTQCILKPVHGGSLARLIGSHTLPSTHLQSLFLKEPHTLQAYIGGTNIRTFVIGRDVVSAELVSDHIDYREDDSAHAQPFALTEQQNRLARRLCQAFHMQWCAIDWRLTEKGELYFLEANPCPYFYHFEVVTQHAITHMLCRLLLRRG